MDNLDLTAREATILVVDDDPVARAMLARILGFDGYRLMEAEGVTGALEILEREPVQLVLCDLFMREDSGFDLLRHLRPRIPDLAVVVVTAADDTASAMECLRLGAFAYIAKPFQPRDVVVHVSSALRRRLLEVEYRDRHELLEARVRERTTQLRESQLEIAIRLLTASEARDNETGAHVRRIGLYAAEMARLLGWPEDQVDCILAAAPMHDLGKIGVPDRVLCKPGALDPEEWTLMQQHTAIGARILKGSQVPFIQMGARIAACHHEKWDGTGYPHGLKGEQIPLEARITALVDVYDALSSRRHYKTAWDERQVLACLVEGRGTHFDPDLFDLFLEHLDRMREIRVANPDHRETEAS